MAVLSKLLKHELWSLKLVCLTNAIAQLADVRNPKRLYYIRQEVANCCVNKLKNSLKMLLELELMLKSGVDEKLALQTQIIKLCS